MHISRREEKIAADGTHGQLFFSFHGRVGKRMHIRLLVALKNIGFLMLTHDPQIIVGANFHIRRRLVGIHVEAAVVKSHTGWTITKANN